MGIVTWNPNDKHSNFTLSDDLLTAIKTTENHVGVRATVGKTRGKWYWEVTVINSSSSGRIAIGVAKKDATLSANTNSFAFNKDIRVVSGDEKTYPRVNFGSTKFVNGDVIGVALDLENRTLEFYRNGISMGIAFSGQGVTDGLDKNTVWFPYLTGWYDIKARANFGSEPFNYDIPDGFDKYGAKIDFLLKSNNKIYSLKSNEIKHETKMTSNTAPAPFVASASSQYSTTLIPFRAFNGVNTDTNSWATVNNTKTGWIQIDYGENNPKKVNCVYVTNRNDVSTFLTTSPRDFNILGSNDGVSFTKLKEVKNQTNWTQNETRKFLLGAVSNYRYYRLEILDNNGATYTAIGEILYSYIENLTQLPSDSVDNFIKYGSSSIKDFDLINGNKNYILQDTVSEDTNGLWVQEIDRKPLSIKFE